MDTSTKPLTKKEIIEAKEILGKGRTRYDNAIFEIEQLWGKLKLHDYGKREKLMKAAFHMAKIGRKLTDWESKLRSE